jgi:hypothetical protein
MKEMQTTVNNSREQPESMEPHFNDERTIRSAQPVVPLNTVVKERRQRRLLLGAAFVIACLLGSTAALALISLRQPSVVADKSEAAVEPKAEDTQEQAAQSNVTETSEVLPANESDSEDITSEVVDHESTKAKKKSRKHAAAPSQVRIMVNTSPSDNGQARMVSQWEEKRQRRVNRERDPDNRQNHHSSDLFRIREIFEGPRRARRINNQ